MLIFGIIIFQWGQFCKENLIMNQFYELLFVVGGKLIFRTQLKYGQYNFSYLSNLTHKAHYSFPD